MLQERKGRAQRVENLWHRSTDSNAARPIHFSQTSILARFSGTLPSPRRSHVGGFGVTEAGVIGRPCGNLQAIEPRFEVGNSLSLFLSPLPPSSYSSFFTS